MPTTTLAVLRRRISEKIADWTSGTTSGNGNAGGTTVVDTGLAGKGNDFYNGWWLLITSGTYATQVRQVSTTVGTGFVASTGTLTVTRAFGGQILASVTYELHRYNPDNYLVAINRKAEDLLVDNYLPLRDESIVIDNLLANADFESTIAAADWTAVGAPTVTYPTTRYMWGTRSIQIASAGGAAGQVTQAPVINQKEITGMGAHMGAWVYTTAASTGRIRLDWDGTTIESHDYHSGKDQWEYQTLDLTIPTTATQVKAICESVAAGTTIFDGAWLAVRDIYRYVIPSAMIRGPFFVGVQRDLYNPRAGFEAWDAVTFEEDSSNRYLTFIEKPDRGYRIQLQGLGLLTTLTTDATTIELGAPELNWLIVHAGLEIIRMAKAEPGGDDPHLKEIENDLIKDINNMMRGGDFIRKQRISSMRFKPAGWRPGSW